MKIVIPTLPLLITKYVAQCLQSLKNDNINTLMWNSQKSIVDVFDELQPEIIFLHTSQINQAFATVCNEFSFKYVLIVTDQPIPTTLPQSPSAIFDLSSNDSIITSQNNVMSPTAMANIPDIYDARYIDKYKSEILIDTTFTSGIDSDIIDLLSYLANEYCTKIIGDQPVPLHNYIGKVNMIDRAIFLKSAKIVIDINTNEHALDAAYLKVPTLCTHPTNSDLIYCSSLNILKQNLHTLFSNELAKKEYITQIYKSACNNTSFIFTSKLFNRIGEVEISHELLKTQEALL